MRRRPIVAFALALAVGTTAVACGSDDAAGPQILRVGSDYDTIQDAVDAAGPGDLVLIAPGTYNEAVEVTRDQLVIRGEDRNTVILDGQNELTNGFEVKGDQVAIENLTVRRFAINGVLFTGGYDEDDPQSGPKGWRASYVTASNNGLYGFYAFGTGPGQFDHNYASGHPDSGIYVGQCQSCGAVVRDNVMERNAIGYENTNASGVTVVGNTMRNNRVGMTIGSGDNEELAPQSGGRIEANLVSDNNEAEAPVTEGGFGFGIVLAGGSDNTVTRNTVTGHEGAGIVLVDQDGYPSEDNIVSANVLTDNAVGMALVAESGGQAEGGGNCFEDNSESKTVPNDLEALLPCEGPTEVLPLESLTYPESPEPFDYREVPEPEDQPNQPGNPEGPWQVPSKSPQELDPASFDPPSD